MHVQYGCNFMVKQAAHLPTLCSKTLVFVLKCTGKYIA